MTIDLSYDLAKKLLLSMQRLDGIVDDLSDLYSRGDLLSGEEMRQELKGSIGEIMSVSFELVGHVVRRYPDLDPDRS
ncbi:MAG: hypothetical protein KZQ96_01960 [Candidatus Thiodiazotropha sp. (ex Lucinoma borealis)]|nr:hypothetical protein [Candidatus Thiodiazotropha sp. (ex Lucinoma borealis)]MCU7870743.1 hypothetical protein [Candidatus Thiodiazotropha sp. (ex Lucinoma borealis)]